MKNKNMLVGTYALAVILIIAWSVKNGDGLPIPRRLFGATTAWTILAVLSTFGATSLASALAAGLDVTLAMSALTTVSKPTPSSKTATAPASVNTPTGAFSSVTSPLVGAGTAVINL